MQDKGKTLPPLFEIPSPFLTHLGKIRLLEPVSAPRKPFVEQLIAGRYPRPFIIENQIERSLHFDLRYVQSSMHKRDPQALVTRYTQKMAGFLLFNAQPERIVILGLGGGSLTKFCHANIANAVIESVEVSDDIIALAPYFDVPTDSERCLIHKADGEQFIRDKEEGSIDLLLIDAFDRDGLAPSITDLSFVREASKRLSDKGMLVINLSGDATRVRRFIRNAERVFPGKVMMTDVSDAANLVMFCFKRYPRNLRWQALEEKARILADQYGFAFDYLTAQLERSVAEYSITRTLVGF